MDLDIDRNRFAPSPESPRDEEMTVPSRFTYEPESPRSNFQGSDADDESDADMEIDEIASATRGENNVDISDSSDGEQVEINEELSTARPQRGGAQAPSRSNTTSALKKRNIAPFAQDWIGGEEAVQRQGNRHPHPKDWIGGEVEDYLGKTPYMRPHPRWKKGTEPDLRPKPKYGGGKKERPAKKVYKKPVQEPKEQRTEYEKKDGWNGQRDKNYLPNLIPFATLLKHAGLSIEEFERSQVLEGRPKTTDVFPLVSLGELVGHLHISIPAPKYAGVQDLRVMNLRKVIPEYWPASMRTSEDSIYFDFGSDKTRERAAWCLYEALLVAFAFTVELIGFDGRVLAFRKNGAAVPEYYDRVMAFKETSRGNRVEKVEQMFGYKRMSDREPRRDFARERECGNQGYRRDYGYGRRENYDRERRYEGDYSREHGHERRQNYDRERDYNYRDSHDRRNYSTRDRFRRESRPHPRKQAEMTAPKKVKHNLDLELPLPPKPIVHGEELLKDTRAKPDAKATFRWPPSQKQKRFGDPEKTSIWGHVQDLQNQKRGMEDREDDVNEAPVVVDMSDKFGKNQAYVESVLDISELHIQSPTGSERQPYVISDPGSPELYIDSPTRYGTVSGDDEAIELSPSYSPVEPEIYSPSEGGTGAGVNEDHQGDRSPSLVIQSPSYSPDNPTAKITDGAVVEDVAQPRVTSPRKRKIVDREPGSFGPLRPYRHNKKVSKDTSPFQPPKKRIRYTVESLYHEDQLEPVDEANLLTDSSKQLPTGSLTKHKRDDRARFAEELRKTEHEADSSMGTSPRQRPLKKARLDRSEFCDAGDDGGRLAPVSTSQNLQSSILSPVKRKRNDQDDERLHGATNGDARPSSPRSQQPPKKKARCKSTRGGNAFWS